MKVNYLFSLRNCESKLSKTNARTKLHEKQKTILE